MKSQNFELAKRHWELAVDSLPQIICLMDPAGRVIRVNRAVERWRPEMKVEAVSGMQLHEMLHSNCSDNRCHLKFFVKRATAALAEKRSIRFDSWDAQLGRHFTISTEVPVPIPKQYGLFNECVAVVRIHDVLDAKAEGDGVHTERRQPAACKTQPGLARDIQKRMRAALDCIPSLFAMTNADGVLYYMNPAGRAMIGLGLKDRIAEITLAGYHAPGVREQLTGEAMQIAKRRGAWSGDSIVLTRDGREVRTALMIIAHYDDDGEPVGYSAYERDMTVWNRFETAIRETVNDSARLSVHHLTIQECERQRIAADLHDGLGQSLSLLKLSIRDGANLLEAGEQGRAVECMKLALSRAENAISELRRIAMGLRPSTLDDLGLLPTLTWFLREFKASGAKIKVCADITVNEADVPESLKIVVFRIIQEAFNNIVKHAHADQIKVGLHCRDGHLQLAIEDNGTGFDPANAKCRIKTAMGLGLKCMRERARHSGGVLIIESAAGKGTAIGVCWPSADSAAAAGAPDMTPNLFGIPALARSAFAQT